jgi:uncharacterized protein (TIGR02271 family)
MQHTLVAIFDNRSDAQSAMDELLASGFARTDVNVSSADGSAPTGSTASASAVADGTHDEGIGASIKHFFSNLFGDEHDEHAHRYAGAVTGGRHVLTVTTQSEPEVERAADVVERFGPVDIDERHDQTGSASTLNTDTLAAGAASGSSLGASAASGTTQRTADMQRDMQRDTLRDDERGTVIPVVQEELQVGKREVQRGGVRVLSRVVSTPVNESVTLREEHVNVERRPVNQPISTADATAFKEQSIELRERAEEAVVQKSARVVEEVVVSKEATQRQETISDTVRHTEVEVEQLGAGSSNDDAYYRNHFATAYGSQGGSYNDYSPAYSYGTQMRGDTRYQGRQWDDVESDLQKDWDSRNTGASTWEKVKAAVRHGWDKTTK